MALIFLYKIGLKRPFFAAPVFAADEGTSAPFFPAASRAKVPTNLITVEKMRAPRAATLQVYKK